jgi:class 3 adenylate cyclase/tetratricopeptide (TPR) repeat protein
LICSNCGTTNEAGRKFCKECGTALAVACANCGAANTPDAKFCGECGTELAAPAGAAGAAHAKSATAPASTQATEGPVAERRLVSVLFADLVGFTTISEGRDPEETRELLSRYFALAREIIDRHGGTVEKFIGDAVMAVWGAPVAREDDAERAVRAALSLVDEVKQLGSEINARAGVLTGEAAVTIGAQGEGMVAGDLVNTASRLQSVAPPGGVLVGETTERAANQGIAFEAAGEQMLKGKSAPVPAYRAVRVVAEVGGKNRAGGLEPPFVGRDDDFRLLKDLFHSTGRDKRPRLVSVMGPAGIGKSRLAWEFSKYTDGLVEDTYWHAGRAPSYGEGVTFWPLSEMVRERAQLAESDDEPTTRAKIHDTVAEWIADEGERRWVEQALLALLGLGEPLPGGRDELFSAWRTFFERIAEHAPTVLLIEDLQWADTGMLEFIDHLLDWTKSLPIFVITLARPELLERRPDWGAGRRNFVSLSLEPLADDDMQALLDGLAPELPIEVRKTIVKRADGIPLYAVEMIRMLVADGRLEERDGVYVPVGDVSAVPVPETLTALIAARLDGLAAAERTILQDAAVLGQSFTMPALAAVSGADEKTLSETLAHFVHRELLTLNADPRSPERGQYSFVQALIREVAYNQLSRQERKTRHLAAARWFETLGDDELASALAGHYAAAHQYAAPGAEADALAAQARVALRAAAERAASLGSHQQAVTLFRQALELTEAAQERADLLYRAGHEAQDQTPEVARELLEQALDLYRQTGYLKGIARAAAELMNAYQSLWRPVEVVPILEQAMEETASIEDEPERVMLLSELTRTYSNIHDPRALELIDSVLKKAERLNDPALVAEGIINRALVLHRAGRYHEPVALLRGVLPLIHSHDLVWSEARALNNLAAMLLRDDLAEALRLGRQGEDLNRRVGNLGTMNYFRGTQVDVLLELGQWDQADQLVDELKDLPVDDPNLVDFQVGRIRLLAVRGEDDAARQSIGLFVKVIEDSSFEPMKVNLLFVQAYTDALASRLDGAVRYAAEGMAMEGGDAVSRVCAEWLMRIALWSGRLELAHRAHKQFAQWSPQGRLDQATDIEASAILASLEGRHDEAAADFHRAMDICRTLGLKVPLGFYLTDMAIALPPSMPGVADAATEARQIWTELGSPPMLARLDEGLARWQKEGAGAAGDKSAAEVETSATA